MLPKSEKIWMNGKFVPWDDATLHVGSHVVHYGSALFEGIRCYNTANGSGIFRLEPHVERLFNSCKIYRMEIPFSLEDYSKAIVETIRVITPVRSIDKIPVGSGKRGAITKRLQDEFFGILSGEREDRHGWFTYIAEAPREGFSKKEAGSTA